MNEKLYNLSNSYLHVTTCHSTSQKITRCTIFYVHALLYLIQFFVFDKMHNKLQHVNPP